MLPLGFIQFLSLALKGKDREPQIILCKEIETASLFGTWQLEPLGPYGWHARLKGHDVCRIRTTQVSVSCLHGHRAQKEESWMKLNPGAELTG